MAQPGILVPSSASPCLCYSAARCLQAVALPPGLPPEINGLAVKSPGRVGALVGSLFTNHPCWYNMCPPAPSKLLGAWSCTLHRCPRWPSDSAALGFCCCLRHWHRADPTPLPVCIFPWEPQPIAPQCMLTRCDSDPLADPVLQFPGTSLDGHLRVLLRSRLPRLE